MRAGNATMPRPPYLGDMDDPATLAALAALDAAEALIALSWPVEPHRPNMDRWQLGRLIWTDDELMGLPVRQGVRPANERMQ